MTFAVRTPRPLKFLRQVGIWSASAEDPDHDGIASARRGDRQAFDALLRVYERPLRGFVARRVASEAVDDVLQETWLAAWVGLPRYGKRARFKAWLFGIALHKCTDYHRTRGRSPEVKLPWDEEDTAEQASAAAHTQTDLYAAADMRHTVRAALRALPEVQREVLELYYYAELTLAEIAQVTGRHESTVKYQFYRAHTQVAQQLSAFFPAAARAEPATGAQTQRGQKSRQTK